jgi:hypothetical protein
VCAPIDGSCGDDGTVKTWWYDENVSLFGED